MEFGIRTALRHFGIAGLLIGTLFVAFGTDEIVLPWLRANLWFLGGWLLALLALGIFADTAVRFEWFERALVRLRGRPPEPSRALDLFRKWSGCSRCVGYWCGGIFSFCAAGLYFPRWFPGSIFFLFLGASLVTGVAVSTHLWRARNAREDLDD